MPSGVCYDLVQNKYNLIKLNLLQQVGREGGETTTKGGQ